jgi:hypothetical protein
MNSHLLLLVVLLTYLLKISGWSSPNLLQKAILKTGHLGSKRWRENVVKRYFEGVRKQDYEMIESCFAETPTIRDVCGISDVQKQVTPQLLAERCRDFLKAHPDTTVEFHYAPTCGRGRSRWVLAHWYENGTWKGESCGIQPKNTPLNVEGQTRFFVGDDLKISDMVVTRTFSDWEKALQVSEPSKSDDTS